jgi:hypothetical protein
VSEAISNQTEAVDSALAIATTDELLIELAKRCDHFVFGAQLKAGPAYRSALHGGVLATRGIVSLLGIETSRMVAKLAPVGRAT